MFQYDRNYDFGLRGAPRRRPGRPESHLRGDYDRDHERRANPAARLSNRVTEPYNYDYLYGERGERHPRNFNPYTGDRPGRIQDASAYRRPYTTDSGTRTWRGGSQPPPYDAADFGPDYGGRYPDEL